MYFFRVVHPWRKIPTPQFGTSKLFSQKCFRLCANGSRFNWKKVMRWVTLSLAHISSISAQFPTMVIKVLLSQCFKFSQSFRMTFLFIKTGEFVIVSCCIRLILANENKNKMTRKSKLTSWPWRKDSNETFLCHFHTLCNNLIYFLRRVEHTKVQMSWNTSLGRNYSQMFFLCSRLYTNFRPSICSSVWIHARLQPYRRAFQP